MEWIKVCKNTIDKPEIVIAAEMLRKSKEEVFGLWFRLYAWADAQTSDGWLPNFTIERIALASGVPADFCFILASDEIRWLLQVFATDRNPKGIQISNWHRHNGKSAKQRDEATRRQQKHRAKTGNKK